MCEILNIHGVFRLLVISVQQHESSSVIWFCFYWGRAVVIQTDCSMLCDFSWGKIISDEILWPKDRPITSWGFCLLPKHLVINFFFFFLVGYEARLGGLVSGGCLTLELKHLKCNQRLFFFLFPFLFLPSSPLFFSPLLASFSLSLSFLVFFGTKL